MNMNATSIKVEKNQQGKWYGTIEQVYSREVIYTTRGYKQSKHAWDDCERFLEKWEKENV